MERITGTLKYYSKTRKGTAQLTGNWDNGKDKMFCTWAEAEPLRDAELVYEHPVERWDDGSLKWCVNGSPEITLEVTTEGRDTFSKVCVNGAAAESTPEASASPPSPRASPSSLDARAAYFGECLSKAAGLWNEEVTDDVLYKTAFTLYKS